MIRRHILIGLVAAAGAGGLTSYRQRRRDARQVAVLEAEGGNRGRTLQSTGAALVDDELHELPPIARRYFRHAVPDGAAVVRAARIRMTGRMRPSANGPMVDLRADELLRPDRGFVWNARLRMRGLPLRVRDSYVDGRGEVRVELLRCIPVQRSRSADVARSSRHRAAGESVWIPTSLLPRLGVEWSTLSDEKARVIVPIDGEAVPLTLTIDAAGRLREVTMMRYGNEGTPSWQLIPYGFAVEEERSFGGYVIPSRIRGGWWYGTDRFDPVGAASFRVLGWHPVLQI